MPTSELTLKMRTMNLLMAEQEILRLQRAATIRGMLGDEWCRSALLAAAREAIDGDARKRGHENQRAHVDGLHDGRRDAFEFAVRWLRDAGHDGAADMIHQKMREPNIKEERGQAMSPSIGETRPPDKAEWSANRVRHSVTGEADETTAREMHPDRESF